MTTNAQNAVSDEMDRIRMAVERLGAQVNGDGAERQPGAARGRMEAEPWPARPALELASQGPKDADRRSHEVRGSRLTETLAAGIASASRQLDELLDAQRDAHSKMFGGAPVASAKADTFHPGAGTITEAQLTQLMAKLHRTISELEAVSYSFMSRI